MSIVVHAELHQAMLPQQLPYLHSVHVCHVCDIWALHFQVQNFLRQSLALLVIMHDG